ncbi:MAG: CotH kinase family protein [Salinivirgaceae bacterium]
MIKSTFFKIIATVFLLMEFFAASLYAQINFPAQSSFKYLKGSNAINLSSSWVNPDFNDADWLTGNAPFRYGDGTGGTLLTDMQGNYSTVYLRTKFTVQQAEMIKEITVKADWDDGFVLFINGIEVVRRQAPEVLSYDALSNGLHEFGEVETIKLLTSNFSIIDGENTMAVFCCNTSLTESSDFYFDLSMSASVPLPELPELIDSVGINFDKPSGFYQSDMALTMTTSVADAVVIYTLDGCNPQISTTRITGSANTQVLIDPASTSNRGTTPAVVVRASIIKDGFSASKPELRTYIYLENVKTQKQPGWDWPTYNVNGQEIDLDMDPDVVNSTEYKDQLDASFLDIPTISLVSDNGSLFSSDSGIYVNAMNDGEEWERQCTVELINPDGSAGFNVNAGLRIRGGWSRHNNYPKHAFRLFFKEEYGDSKLKYQLFEDEGVDHFDKVDLRCEQNYSWANYEGVHNTFIREVFLRDAQGETGEPYTRSRYYHLYLNGMYWGLFQTQERSEARFASDYLGGKNEDWDVLKQGESGVMATDGNKDKWNEVWDMTQTGFAANSDYFRLEGKNAQGKAVKDSEILVDIDNLIDYMINIFYSGNFDSPVSIWGGNNSPNNFYMIKNREDKALGFQFFIHDAEHTMMTVGTSGPGTIGLYENRVNLAYRNDAKMVNPGFDRFHPQWLHHRLTANEEYRIRFADRAWKHLNGNGIFTENACLARLNKRAGQIELAVIAESARWGDSHTSFAYTKADWETELNSIRNSYFPYRGDILIEQLLEYELYPSVSTATISMNGSEILDEKVFLSSSATITFSASKGEIYYTLMGDDPRMVGGELSPKAIKIESGATLFIPESAIVKARVYSNGIWSAIRKIDFIAEQVNYSKLKVTELHYHPLDSIVGIDTIQDDNFEFIEFKNTGYTSAINLSGLEFISGIEYKFPDNLLLAPQQYFVVAAKPSKLYDRYGLVASGNFAGNFTNSGEEVIIINSKGTVVMDFTFNDTDPWPIEPDGLGYSLVSKMANPDDDPNESNYWKSSAVIHGSPFYEDGLPLGIDADFSAINSNEFVLYPNPTNNELNISYLGNSDDYFTIKLYDVNGTILFAHEYNRNAFISLDKMNINYGVYLLNIESNKRNETRKVVFAPF